MPWRSEEEAIRRRSTVKTQPARPGKRANSDRGNELINRKQESLGEGTVLTQRFCMNFSLEHYFGANPISRHSSVAGRSILLARHRRYDCARTSRVLD